MQAKVARLLSRSYQYCLSNWLICSSVMRFYQQAPQIGMIGGQMMPHNSQLRQFYAVIADPCSPPTPIVYFRQKLPKSMPTSGQQLFQSLSRDVYVMEELSSQNEAPWHSGLSTQSDKVTVFCVLP